MKQAVELSILLLFVGEGYSTRNRAVRSLSPERVLWIGAHPDDEVLIAPILGTSCVDGAARCSLLVMTQGEHGSCALAGGCSDLGAIRKSEMQNAAKLFRASLTQWNSSDVLRDVDSSWSAEAGSHDELVQRIEFVILAEKPTIIYAFDPAHGSTCHPAHRVTGALVLEAVGRLPQTAPRVLLVETRVQFNDGSYNFSPAAPNTTDVDATASWAWVARDLEAHPSQFTPLQINQLQNTPAEQRRIFLLPATMRISAPYTFQCP